MSNIPFALRCLSGAVIAAFAATSQAATPAATETTTLDTVVVTGSYVEHSSFDLPASISSISQEQLKQAGNQVNASEALVAVPGVVVLNRQNYAQDLQISSRGFGARSAFGVRGVRLIADGIPATMPDGQGQAATFNLDTAERIEVLRGPFSVVYGNHAGGVVQLVGKEGKGAPNVEGNFSAGSYGASKVDLSASGEVGGVGYILDSSRFSTNGYREHSQASREQSQAKLSFKPVEDGKLTVLLNSFRQMGAQDPLGLSWSAYQQAPRSVVQAALDYNTRKSIEHTQGGLSYEHRFGQNRLQLTAYSGERSVIQYQSIPKSAQANSRHSGGIIDFDRQFSGVGARWLQYSQVAGGDLLTTVGFDYETSKDERRGYENFIGTGSTCGVNLLCGVKGKLRRQETDSVTNASPYIQAEWQRGAWVATLGARYSHVHIGVTDNYLSNGNDSGSLDYRATTPSASVLYKVTPSLNVYASLGRGFETPTLNELFYSASGGGFNYGLKAATSRNLEVGAKAMLGNDSLLNLAAFQVNTNNELVIDSATGGRTSYKNASSTLRQGLELSASTRWGNGFSARLAATAMRAIYDQDFVSNGTTINAGKRIPGVPALSLFGEVAWQHRASGFSTAVEAQAMGKLYVEDTNQQQAAPGYTTFNWRAGFEQKFGGWSLREYVRVNNVFDKNYVGSVIVGDSNGRYYESAPGRNWLIGVSAKYRF